MNQHEFDVLRHGHKGISLKLRNMSRERDLFREACVPQLALKSDIAIMACLKSSGADPLGWRSDEKHLVLRERTFANPSVLSPPAPTTESVTFTLTRRRPCRCGAQGW